MKVCTLLENTACREDLRPEHGLSLYLETKGRKLLFDSGQSDAFAENALKMGVDLSRVDAAILSHGHYDHGGGLETFLKCNDHAKIYVNQNAFRPFYNGTSKYIGLPETLRQEPRIVPVGDDFSLGEGIRLLSCAGWPLKEPIRSYGLNVRQGDTFLPDDFRHEQYLLVEEDGKRILISGCSHKGIRNIEAWFTPDVLIGGFHFKKLDPIADRPYLEAAARELLASPTVYYTGHCTGLEQYKVLKAIMQDRLHRLSTGRAFTV